MLVNIEDPDQMPHLSDLGLHSMSLSCTNDKRLIWACYEIRLFHLDVNLPTLC